MKFNTFLFATSMVASFSLSAQPSTDEVLRTAPTVTQTAAKSDLASAWWPASNAGDAVHFLTPSGSKVETTAGDLLAQIEEKVQLGIFSLYFVSSGLRMDLIVEEQ